MKISDVCSPQIQALKEKPQHNGKIAMLEAFDNETLRWVSRRWCWFHVNSGIRSLGCRTAHPASSLSALLSAYPFSFTVQRVLAERQGFHEGTHRSPYMAQQLWASVQELVTPFSLFCSPLVTDMCKLVSLSLPPSLSLSLSLAVRHLVSAVWP
jgi:hypothetical protein